MNNIKIELRWGVLYSLLTIIWGIVEQKIGWHNEHINFQLFFHLLVTILILTVVLVVVIRKKRRYYYNGEMSWKQGVFTGGKFAIIITLFSVFTQYFIYHYISPEFFNNAINYVTHKEHYPMSVKDAKEIFSMKSYIIQGLQDSFSFSLVISAIVAFILKKEDKNQ